MANTLTGNSPQREQRVQSLILDRLVLKYERRIAREIVRAMRESASSKGTTKKIINKHRSNTGRILIALWNDSALTMSEYIIKPKKALTDVLPVTIQDTVVRDWINTYGLQLITKITRTTQDDVKKVISDGVRDGLSEREITQKIYSIAPTVGAKRAQAIARTETHGAANLASKATADAAGIEMEREWSAATGSNRTRESHLKADGQRVGMNEPFIVGGVKLMYPGDSGAGSPSQTINCRCVVVYVIKR